MEPHLILGNRACMKMKACGIKAGWPVEYVGLQLCLSLPAMGRKYMS